MSAHQCSDEVDAELQALEAVQGEAYSLLSRDPVTVIVRIRPHVAEEAQQYVDAQLRLQLSQNYPAVPPSLQLQNTRGLEDNDTAGLQQALAREAQSLVGECMLGHLCAHAQELLTDVNHPQGHCAFCLFGMSGSSAELVKLPCYHCFHLHCFAPWWTWQQRHLSQQWETLQTDLGAAAAAHEAARLNLVRNKAGRYDIACPNCRQVVLSDALDVLEKKLGKAALRLPVSSLHQQQPLHQVVNGADLSALKAAQQQRAALFAKQQARGAIVEDRYAVMLQSLSLQEPRRVLPPASSSSLRDHDTSTAKRQQRSSRSKPRPPTPKQP